jgi:hypothetical protein
MKELKKPETIEIKKEELVEAKRLIHEALSPTVKFSNDLPKMSKEAEENRNHTLSLLLGWICQYVPSK